VSAPHRDRFVATYRRAAEIRAAGVQRHGSELIDLARSEPDAAHLAAHPDPATAWELTDRYLPNAGASAARERVAEQLARDTGVPFTARHVAVVGGGLVALTSALAALAGPGDEVILPVPHYGPSPSQIELSGARPVPVVGAGERDCLTPERLARAVTPRTVAVVLTSPCNPTGIVYSDAELAALDAVLPPRVAWLIDEAYADVIHGDGPRPCPAAVLWGTRRRWLTMRTASKTVGRPGLRTAVLAGTPELLERIGAVLACTAGAANAFGQVALPAALRAAAAQAGAQPYAERLRAALEAFAAGGLRPLTPEGSYYLWVRGPLDGPPIGTLDAVARLCEEQALFASPGILYGDARGLRISLSCPSERLAEGARRLAAHVGATRPPAPPAAPPATAAPGPAQGAAAR
jgi:aspartate aminotransferase